MARDFKTPITVSGSAVHTAAGPTVMGSVQSSTTLGNNFSLNATSTVLRYTGTANATLTGISAAGATPADGRILLLLNATAFTITLSHASASSTAAYRFALPGATDVSLAAQEGILLVYDGGSSLWRGAYPFSVAGTAAALSSARTFALTGDITGSVSSDLTSGASIATSIGTGVIVDADISASAAIQTTKLASNTITVNGTAIALGGSGTATAAAGTLTGTTLNSTVTASSLTSFGSTPTITAPLLTLSTTASTADGRIYWDTATDTIRVGTGTSFVAFNSNATPSFTTLMKWGQ